MRSMRPPLPAASQPSMPMIDPAAGAQVMDLQVEQTALQLVELVLVGLLVDRTVDHLDLVQDRPLAHRFLRRGIVPAPARARQCSLGRLTARTVATTNLANGRRRTHNPLHGARREARRSRSAAPGPCSACAASGTRLEKALQRGGQRQGRAPGRRERRGAARHGGRPGNPASSPAADRTPRSRPPTKAHADLVRGRAEEQVRGAARQQHVNWFAHWLEEVGHDIGQSLSPGHQSLRLLRRDPRCLRRGLPGAAPLSRQRGGAPDVRGLDPGAGDRRRAVLPDRRGDRLPGRAAAQAVRRRDLHGGSGRYRHVP